ncbi:MAG: endonuclease III [Anaerolineae bacterium]|nr:endonuclease III [Anaerolineae bacterium]
MNKILQIHERLADCYGSFVVSPSEPLAELVNTILSQNTNDRNRDIAFAQLVGRYPTWEAVRDAPEAEIIEAIRPAGLAPSKGPRIQVVLRRITAERGELSLDFLREMPFEEARAWLRDLDGVGPKTAAIVLLFSLGLPAFPVDTHIHRVTLRLGLIPPNTSREAAHDLLEALVPVELYYPFHLEIIQHGRSICQARRPQCEVCVLQDLCDDFKARTAI